MKKLMCLMMVLCVVGLAQADLIVHYNMEETAGPLTDQAGGETAEAVGAGHVYGVTGPAGWGNAAGLGGSGAWDLDLAESAELINLTNNITVAAWVNWDSALDAAKTGLNSNNDRIIGDDGPWDRDTWSFGIKNGTLIFTKNGIIDIVSSVAVPQDEWTHVAVVVSATAGVDFYLNGVLSGHHDDTRDMYLPGSSTTSDNFDDIFSVGRSYGDGEAQWFAGSLDEVRVYNETLTDTEIAALLVSASDKAIHIGPAIGAMTVDSATAQLEWSAPGDITPASYTLYMRANDPNMDDAGTTTVVTNATSPYTPSPVLSSETTYYWKVDTIESGTATVYPGMLWHFRTAPAVPYVLTDPVSQIVAVGADVALTVDAINVDSYQWYQGNDMVPDATAATLEITGIEFADEGYYFCRLTNTEGPVDSASARILTERLYNNWQLNDDMVDSVSGNDGQGWGGDPNFAPGNDGSSSVLLYGDNAVQVPNDPEMNFYAFTVSLWAKVDGGSGSYRAAISNRDDGPQRGFIIYAVNTNAWQFWTGPGWNKMGSEPVVVGEWIHLVGSVDSNGVKKLYVNGVLANEAEVVYSKSTDQDLFIGAGQNESPANFYFNGQIDDVQLYNYAIDPVEIALLYTDVEGGNVCYEFPEFDLNEDCYVNLSDFAMMASQWLECNLVPASNCQ